VILLVLVLDGGLHIVYLGYININYSLSTTIKYQFVHLLLYIYLFIDIDIQYMEYVEKLLDDKNKN